VIVAALGESGGRVDEASGASCRRGWRRHRHQLGEFSEVLSGSGEVELVAGTAGTAKSEPVDFQDAFEVSEKQISGPLLM
jgi:hypothetical protein